ncbi:MAG: hypothetical protein QXI97_05280 [Nitrososphaerota archaeon]
MFVSSSGVDRLDGFRALFSGVVSSAVSRLIDGLPRSRGRKPKRPVEMVVVKGVLQA